MLLDFDAFTNKVSRSVTSTVAVTTAIYYSYDCCSHLYSFLCSHSYWYYSHSVYQYVCSDLQEMVPQIPRGLLLLARTGLSWTRNKRGLVPQLCLPLVIPNTEAHSGDLWSIVLERLSSLKELSRQLPSVERQRSSMPGSSVCREHAGSPGS